jgi:multiple sugar transport system ATP-binding protein
MTLRLPGATSIRPGTRMRAIVDVERLHFFDPETEQAVALADRLSHA